MVFVTVIQIDFLDSRSGGDAVTYFKMWKNWVKAGRILSDILGKVYIAELVSCSSVWWKLELVSNEIEYLRK
jgi:hypothetical protein